MLLLLINPSAQVLGDGTVKFHWTPHLQFGTHTNGLGLDSKISQNNNLKYFSVSKNIFGSLDQYRSYLNVPGAATVISFGGGVSIGIGSIVNGPVPWSRPCTSRSHQIWYDCKVYYDNRGTSQPSGRIGYLYRANSFSIGAAFEDDIFVFQGKDKFRTGAFEIASSFRNPFGPLVPDYLDVPLRISAGVKVWTGAGPFYRLSSNPSVKIRSPGPSPAGILYGGLALGPVGIQIGWDSDQIRSFFQNNIHRLVNNPIFSVDDADKGRLFVGFTLFSNGDLY